MRALSVSQILTLAACGIAGVYGAAQIVRAILASRWPFVEGEIANTRLVRRTDGQDGSSDYEYVAYRYSVGGRPYRNDRVRFGPQVVPSSVVPQLDPEPNQPRAAEDLARRYPRGKTVRVYYNPRRPEESVLFLIPDLFVWCILVAAGVFAYATLYGHW